MEFILIKKIATFLISRRQREIELFLREASVDELGGNEKKTSLSSLFHRRFSLGSDFAR